MRRESKGYNRDDEGKNVKLRKTNWKVKEKNKVNES